MCDLEQILCRNTCVLTKFLACNLTILFNRIWHFRPNRNEYQQQDEQPSLTYSLSVVSYSPYMILTKVLISLVYVCACLSVIGQMWPTTDLFFSQIYLLFIPCYVSALKAKIAQKLTGNLFLVFKKLPTGFIEKQSKRRI